MLQNRSMILGTLIHRCISRPPTYLEFKYPYVKCKDGKSDCSHAIKVNVFEFVTEQNDFSLLKAEQPRNKTGVITFLADQSINVAATIVSSPFWLRPLSAQNSTRRWNDPLHNPPVY